MLELQLAVQNNQVNVNINGKASHRFPLLDLSQSEQGWKDFLDNPRVYGEKLFNALFKDAARKTFDELSKQNERIIVLILESPELEGVAWEYAYNKAKEEYVVEDCAFVRALPEKERPANGRIKNEVERVPLLFIPTNPLVDLSGEPMRALDVEGEWREMKQHIEKSNAPFDMVELRPATPEALQSVMARFQNGMIAHFSGHGATTKDGAILLFERENGASNPLEAREFVREIKDKAWIGFLSACQSAVPERTEFSNLARELAKAGVPFALGMQFNLPDPFAPNISGQFYNYLAHGHAVPEAARQARRAVKRENEFFVGMIALYAAHPDEVGRLSWRGAGAQTVSLFRPADVSDLPTPASGLIGRQRELMTIGTRLFNQKKRVITLHGAGGIGKTALLREALLRFAPSFELTLAIGLDTLPSLESVLGRIERFLGLPSPCSNDTKEREALVRNALTSKRTLLGLDNFETLNYALNEKGSDEEKTAKSLHTFFKSLAANGVTLCVTSREVTNLGGETVEDIKGLTNESGGRLFQENVVRQKDEIYIEKTQQVSEMVGGHPLALRLLASAFDDQAGTSLDQYIEDLQSFLPKARDKWTEEDRHESLRASFDFTMNNLLKTVGGKQLEVALARLSIFIAFFAQFTAAPVLENKHPENEEEDKAMRVRTDNTLRQLWERGLLERLTLPLEDENFYLYRLHPVLNQFAAEHVTLEDKPAMQENYFRAMRQLASRAHPVNEGSGIFGSPVLTAIVRAAMLDLLKATKLKQDKEAASLLFYTAFLQTHFGDLDGAMKLYQQSLQIDERLGNLQGKSATLYEMANVYVTHGDLDGAMTIYRRVLEIVERLGDLQGKSAALHQMAGIYVTRGDLDGAMKLYQQSLEIKEELSDLQSKSITLHEK
jgi:tetratricopeptide (TPR) repeat protein